MYDLTFICDKIISDVDFLCKNAKSEPELSEIKALFLGKCGIINVLFKMVSKTNE